MVRRKINGYLKPVPRKPYEEISVADVLGMDARKFTSKEYERLRFVLEKEGEL